MWRDICLTNREAISTALRLFATSFKEFADAVNTADEKRLMELFERGRRMREQLK